MSFKHLISFTVRLEGFFPTQILQSKHSKWSIFIDNRQDEHEFRGCKDTIIQVFLTWLHRDTWKMFPSLPPQNRKYSQGSKVTDMISTSKRTDSSSSPEDSSHTCRNMTHLSGITVDQQVHDGSRPVQTRDGFTDVTHPATLRQLLHFIGPFSQYSTGSSFILVQSLVH